MKNAIVAILLLTTATYGQQHSLPPDRTLPPASPGSSLAGTVTLPLTEYNRLLELASSRPVPPEPAPIAFVLSSAAYKLSVDGDAVVGIATIEGDLLRTGPVMVPLATRLTVLEAASGQDPLPVERQGATDYGLLAGPGHFSLSLKIAAPVAAEVGRASFLLPVAASGSAVASVDLSGNHVNVHVEPGLVTSRTNADSRTEVEATLEPGQTARVWWTTRDAAAPVAEHQARFLADIKTLISVGDSQVRLAALCDVSVIQGEPAEFRVPLPAGFELTEATGSSLESTEIQAGSLVLKVREPGRRAHQFLIEMERRSPDTKLDAPFIQLDGAQRETGEVLVEAVSAMDLTATEGGGLRRVDVKEASSLSRSLARYPVEAAFRYHRRPSEAPKLDLQWSQFPDSPVLSALAERATVTTLVNGQGKALTEVTLKVRNHQQVYLKVELPQGATIVTAEVEGQPAKPVLGPDGSRVPLLRPGLPSGAYTVSFVYLNSGPAFGKTGDYEMALPKMDVPISLTTWEILLPERLQVKRMRGDALSESEYPAGLQAAACSDDDLAYVAPPTQAAANQVNILNLMPGQIGGVVVDPMGAVIAKANVTVDSTEYNAKWTTQTDDAGRWVVSGVRPGPARVKVEVEGFKTAVEALELSPDRPATLGTTLQVGSKGEEITITSGSPDMVAEVQTRNRSAEYDVNGLRGQSTSRGGTITTKQIDNMSITSRSSAEMLRIMPGVTAVTKSGTRTDSGALEVDGSHVADIGSPGNGGGTGSGAGMGSGYGNAANAVGKDNQNYPSQNVFRLQQRVSGILPVAVEIPREGRSYRFVRPLVLDEETKVSFQYKLR